MSPVVKDSIRRIAELQELHETTGASTIRHINAILAELSIDDLLAVGAQLKLLGIAGQILSGRMRKARKADDAVNSVVYGKNAAEAVNVNAR